MIYVSIVLYGRTIWEDLKAESHPRRKGPKREKTLCAELYSPLTGGFFVMGEKSSYNEIL